MAGYWLLILHLTGDYLLQSDWMASEKTKTWRPAAAHALVYTLPFMLLFGLQWEPLLLIGGSHLVIDHYRLARHICWAKNFLAPRSWYHLWGECQPTGYHKDKPLWLTLWLMILADNTLHLAFNGLAWYWWGKGGCL